MRIHIKHLKYFLWHKWFVFWECYKLGIPWLGIIHDLSKFWLSEWIPYTLNYYGDWKHGGRPQWVIDAFDMACLLHRQHRNKHHWQYWVLVQGKEETRVLPIPDKYRKEMLADWKGAGYEEGNSDALTWYLNNRTKIWLHSETRAWIEKELML